MESEIENLSKQITPERYKKMLYALSNRTFKLAVALEDIYQPHNSAAVMRSCDAFGVQKVFVIENRYPLKISGNVDMGASKWLDIKRFKSKTCTTAYAARNRAPNEFDVANTKRAIDFMKAEGYTVAASTLQGEPMDIDELPLDKPLAIMMGTELTGLSQTAQDYADLRFKFNMRGFTQSLNISVFTAICLAQLTKKLHEKGDWQLSQSEQNQLLLKWLKA